MNPSDAAFMERFRATLEHVNAGALGEAELECAALLRAAPDDPAVLQLHATISLRRGLTAEALRAIRRSLQLRPSHAPSLITGGRAARARGALREAAGYLRAAITSAPALPEPVFLLCRTLLDLDGVAHEAELDAALAHAHARFPTPPSAWLDLGLRLREAGRLTQAKAALAKAALAKAVELAQAAFALGLTCQDLNDEAGAAAAYRAALDAQPDFAEAAVNLGIALQRLGEMDGAVAAYRRAMQSRPDCFGRIAQALTASGSGVLWLDPGKLRAWLERKEGLLF